MTDLEYLGTTSIVGAFFLLYLLIVLIVSAIAIASYVLQAWSLHSIAKRRGIDNPWLAWIPVANSWLLGAIADHYRLTVQAKATRRRKILLGLHIAVLACSIVVCVTYFVLGLLWGLSGSDDSSVLLLLAMVLYLPVLALSIVRLVFQYIALSDVYRSCDPHESTLYLVFSILGDTLFKLPLTTVFLLVCRKKDRGMAAPQIVQGNTQD